MAYYAIADNYAGGGGFVLAYCTWSVKFFVAG